MEEDRSNLRPSMTGAPKLVPLVTAVVPSFNHESYIRERIDSILGQTYVNLELIVIDDRSQDDSDRIIREMQMHHGFTYIRNDRNSGTPFSAWQRICTLAKGDFIWICESDDVAEPNFLETAVRRLADAQNSVLFYCNSLVIDSVGTVVGNTNEYFHGIWKESRWDGDFSASGEAELRDFQIRGQTVPNMSSALIRSVAFRKAFDPYLKRFQLTGDWLFVGELMRYGGVEFAHAALSRFRKHEVTSRVRVKSARSQAEFMLTKYRLFQVSGLPKSEFGRIMGTDVVRFLYEPASFLEVLNALTRISVPSTLGLAFCLAGSTLRKPEYLEKFLGRRRHARAWWQEKK